MILVRKALSEALSRQLGKLLAEASEFLTGLFLSVGFAIQNSKQEASRDNTRIACQGSPHGCDGLIALAQCPVRKSKAS